ncbi:cell division protein FtsL [Xinfangfangia sp. CPCC 101601]|uniref:Cell division protein FtsL n=1 Tax=Pseudogemmobacter lacusdianii TaxID=3069608 RepID=A0ABU0VTG6_9RHOB|nr:cell division protein FtsL [Xinfangfangia sp. CPCC 101601]MDQ2065016.1 cell division protein FtsL [Xinfangfangia sp. CPCC 101601]
MRPVLYVLTFLGLIALGFWAYRENYATQAALREVRGLQNEIANLREALSVQRAEWAYLNRPERLRDLAGLNFDTLKLLPMEPQQFGAVAQVVMPVPEIAPITGPIDSLSGMAAVDDNIADQVEAIVATAAGEGL